MVGKIKDVEIRPATAEDIRLFYPDGPPRTSYSWIALYKGLPACLAGLIVERGGCIAYSEVKPDIAAPKLTVWRTAHALLAHICALKLPMYAACEFHDKMAQAFVMRLGFKHERKFQGSELFIWQE